jgi:hypothetical protein
MAASFVCILHRHQILCAYLPYRYHRFCVAQVLVCRTVSHFKFGAKQGIFHAESDHGQRHELVLMIDRRLPRLHPSSQSIALLHYSTLKRLQVSIGLFTLLQFRNHHHTMPNVSVKQRSSLERGSHGDIEQQEKSQRAVSGCQQARALTETTALTTWQQAEIEMNACVASNFPTVHQFVYERLAGLLHGEASIVVGSAPLLMCPDDLRTCSDPPQASLRRIQLQGMLRLQLWAIIGNVGLEPYYKHAKKVRNDRKKIKKQSPSAIDFMWNDITSIFSMAAFRLPQSLAFVHFLHSCFDPSLLNSKLPKNTLDKLCQHFEVSLPFQHELAKDSALDILLLVSPPRKQQQPRKVLPFEKKPRSDETSVSSTLSSNSSTTLCPITNLVLGAGVQLTATNGHYNSLLKEDSRTRFVGSHFNTNLSNMSNLFRQVKVVVPPPTTSTIAPSQITNARLPLSLRTGNNSTNPTRKRPRDAPLRHVAKEHATTIPRRPIVLETPKKRASSSRWCGAQHLQSNASLVAEALRETRR